MRHRCGAMTVSVSLYRKVPTMKMLIHAKPVTLCLALICTALFALPSQAQESARIQRFFFHFLPLDAPETGANWVAEGSQRIAVQSRNLGLDTLMFGFPDYVFTFDSDYEIRDTNGDLILDLRGTTWARASVVHITEDGVEKVDSVYWLLGEGEDPKVLKGLTAATGPDGDVGTLENVSLGAAGDGTLYILRNNLSNPVRFSIGWFNK